MSARMTSQPAVGAVPARTANSRTSDRSRNEEGGTDHPTRRKLHKPAPSATQGDAARVPNSPASKKANEPRGGFPGRRRPSVRDNKPPSALQHDSLTRRNRSGSIISASSTEGTDTARHYSIATSNSSARMTSFASSTKDEPANTNTSESIEFLAPINFDDFHNSIMEEPSLNHFPRPGHGGAGYSSTTSSKSTNFSTPGTLANGSATTGRAARSGSFRRQSDVSRLTGYSTNASTTMPPPPAPSARTRRQSHAPVLSSTGGISARPPRKSIGPGITDGSAPGPLRRPSLSGRKPSGDLARGEPGAPAARLRTRNLDVPNMDNSQQSTNSRTLKTKSLQPPLRDNSENLLKPMDHSRSSSSNGLGSPSKHTAGEPQTPSSASKRMSTMPHATGLGARTISPTDARRMKRISMMPPAPPLPNTPPTHNPPQLETNRAGPRTSVQSPSLIPRKSVTPSSSRTTPDHNRKSISSGISLSSNTSYNSARNSSGSFQPRLSQNLSTSRLPTPKPRNENLPAQPEEEVPPVPAIPKAYESPKAEFEVPASATNRKSSFPFDLERLSISSKRDSNTTNGVPSPIVPAEEAPATTGNDPPRTPDSKGAQNSNASKKNMQRLNLPPLNLLPLSTPMAAKIDALKDALKDANDSAQSDPRTTTPLHQTGVKTPSTPMTASKASSYLGAGDNDSQQPNFFPRSSTSHFLISNSTPSAYRAPSAASAITSIDIPVTNRGVSPYISSSFPKTSGDFSFMRPKVSGEYSRLSGQSGKPIGPRPQTQSSHFSSNPETSSLLSSTPENEKPASSLRTRLASTLRHSASKPQLASETESIANKYDNMPPPRLPASATWNGLAAVSSSPTMKPPHFKANRKSSVSSLTTADPNARKSSVSSEQSLRPDPSPSTDSGDLELTHGRSSSSILSPVQKILSSAKSNVSSKHRPIDPTQDPGEAIADEEMRKLGHKRKDFEVAAKELDELRRRASPKERVSPAQALKMASLNIFERGEIIDFKDIYFCGTQKAKKHVGDLKTQSANFGYDDERGDYQIVIGDHLAYRYEIVDLLGKGSFGQVVRCVDHKTGQLVAVKIIRNKKRFHQQALVEVNILQKLKEWDPERKHSVVKFTQSFYFRGHLCISTELLGMNLYEFIKAHDFKGFSLKLIRQFTKQMLSTLVLLHGKKVIHCDLKPENILLSHPLRSEIRVIDFGSSCFEHEKVYTYIQSRFYRSPEVILGMSYGMPIDMWSLGCILAELYTGYPIFPGENEQEQLACIMEVFGPPEKHLIDKSTRKKLFFDSMGKPRLTVSSKGRRRRPSSKDLKQALKCDDEAFLDFIARCLRWDPARRLNPIDALRHEFVTGVKMSSRSRSHFGASTNAPMKRTNPTLTSSSSIRPLPEPPALKTGSTVRNVPSSSPSKGMTGPRRQSNMGTTTSGPAAKRGSNSGSFAGSALPRVATRSASGKPDLAAAAAATSLKMK